MLKPLVFLVGRVIARDARLEITDRQTDTHLHTHRPSTVTLTARCVPRVNDQSEVPLYLYIPHQRSEFAVGEEGNEEVLNSILIVLVGRHVNTNISWIHITIMYVDTRQGTCI